MTAAMEMILTREREKLLGILEPFSEMNPISRVQILIWVFILLFYFIYKI